MARDLKFLILKVEGLYYPCSENKGADQLSGYRKADLRLCFRICKKPVFSRRGSFHKESQFQRSHSNIMEIKTPISDNGRIMSKTSGNLLQCLVFTISFQHLNVGRSERSLTEHGSF